MKDTKYGQVLFIPCAAGVEKGEGPYTLTLERGGNKIVIDGLVDLKLSQRVYVFDVDERIAGATGEYDYMLAGKDSDQPASLGIATLGDYYREFKMAAKEPVKVVEYDG